MKGFVFVLATALANAAAAATVSSDRYLFFDEQLFDNSAINQHFRQVRTDCGV